MNEEEKQQFRQAIDEAVKVLNRGGVILYPTDTVWGLGCDATNSEAVRRIFAIKRRDDSKAMLSLVDAVGRVDYYFSRVPEIAWDLWEVADKPLTLILPRARNVAPELIADDGTVQYRNRYFTQGDAEKEWAKDALANILPADTAEARTLKIE